MLVNLILVPRFHAIYLPAILTALGLPLSRQILAHSHWTVDQKKMSKSIGNVADPIEAINEHGVDIVRWYLARVGGRWRTDVGKSYYLVYNLS
jgi:methionyl-tRNA synthetase